MRRQSMRRHCGAIMPLLCLVLPILLVFSAMAINVAYIQLAHTQLQVSTDAAARAAGRSFFLTQDITEALIKALEAGEMNPVCGESLRFQLDDLETGVSIRPNASSRYDFVPSSANCNALRLAGNRTSASLNGAVRTLLPTFIGTTHLELTAHAVSSQPTVDLVLVMDRSGSMAFAANEPTSSNPPAAAPPGWGFGDAVPNNSRWLDAVDGIVELLLELQQSPQPEYVGLATYSNNASLDILLTDNYINTTNGMDYYSQSFSGGSTNIAAGIDAGQACFSTSPGARAYASKVIVVLTDGIVTQGTSPVQAATSAAANGVSVFTVTFSNEADIPLMQAVAAAGKGQHFHAVSREDLLTVFGSIGRNLPNLITK